MLQTRRRLNNPLFKGYPDSRIEPFDFETNIGTTVAINNFKQKTGQLCCVKYFIQINVAKRSTIRTSHALLCHEIIDRKLLVLECPP